MNRDSVETCFVDVIRAVGNHEMSTSDQALLATLLLAGAIHASLEDATARSRAEAERARLAKLLHTLQELVRDWTPQHKEDITDALFSIREDGRTDAQRAEERPDVT